MAASEQEQFLVELAQWMARVAQYSAKHPACAALSDKTQAALVRATAKQPLVEVRVAKDNVLVDGATASHPAVKTRIAPHLHERGVLCLRFAQGTATDELAALVELLTLPVQTTFDRGGLRRLAAERGIARIQIEELAHDVTTEEREAQKRRLELRSYFAEELRRLRAEREGLAGKRLLELLDYPDIATTILEEDQLGLATAVAGLCMMVRQEGEQNDEPLYPKLEKILLALSPSSHDRLMLGLPALVGDFRQALVWALDGLSEDDLARVAFPAIRRHAAELDVSLYALGAAVPHDGRRYSVLRRLALFLYDLPVDDQAGSALLDVLAAPVDEHDSYRGERLCLAEHARHAAAMRQLAPAPQPPRTEAPEPFDARRSVADLVKLASRTRRFGQLCDKLPAIAGLYSEKAGMDAVAGIVRGLRDVTRAESRELAQAVLKNIATPELTTRLLADLDKSAVVDDSAAIADVGTQLEELVGTVRFLVALAPSAVFDRLETSESRRMRQIMTDALAGGGASILPLVKAKLAASSWHVVRNAVSILPRVGGTAADLKLVARHANEKVRLEVVRALRALPPDTVAMDMVATYLADPSAEVRRFSAPLLRGDLLTPAAISTLEHVAADEKLPEELRRRVIEALGRSPLDAAAGALFRTLQPRGLIDLGALRDVAAVALYRSAAPAARGYFAEGLKSESFRVRKSCERAAEGGQS